MSTLDARAGKSVADDPRKRVAANMEELQVRASQRPGGVWCLPQRIANMFSRRKERGLLIYLHFAFASAALFDIMSLQSLLV